MASQETILPFAEPAVPDALAGGALAAFRADGLAAYLEAGLPNHRVEAWKWTRLKALEDHVFRATSESDAAVDVPVTGLLEADQRAALLVFVNGRPRIDLSDVSGLPAGVRLTPASAEGDWVAGHVGKAIDTAGDGLLALNDAAFDDGWMLSVERGAAVEKPIEIVSIGSPTGEAIAWFPRNIVALEENAEAVVLVHHADTAGAPVFVNAVTEATLATNARLKLYAINAEGADTTLVSRLHARLDRTASLETFVLDEGAGLTRNESVVLLEGEGAEARIDGGYLLRGSAHADNTTLIEHRVPNTTCNEVFKGVVDDTARAVFQGKIVVCKDAQHTDGQMLNFFFNDTATTEIYTKPELEIYADDVKCAHGATSGRIDETALFYLRSRGIPEDIARNLLVRSFLGEATERIGNTAIRDLIAARIEAWLPESALIEEHAA